jgi:hypothetical protein
MAECHALLRIGERRRERSLRNASGLRADTNAPAIKRGESNLVALALIAKAICGGHFAMGKHEFATGRRVEPSFFSSLPTWKPAVPFSTTSAVMPFSPLAGSVLTYTRAASAKPPLVTHAFVPFSTCLAEVRSLFAVPPRSSRPVARCARSSRFFLRARRAAGISSSALRCQNDEWDRSRASFARRESLRWKHSSGKSL